LKPKEKKPCPMTLIKMSRSMKMCLMVLDVWGVLIELRLINRKSSGTSYRKRESRRNLTVLKNLVLFVKPRNQLNG